MLSGDPATCVYATLDSPSTQFRDGRVYVRARFAGATAALVNGRCVGSGDTFWLTVSAAPAVAGETVGLRDPRLEEGNDVYRPLIELFLTAFAPRALNVNLRDEVTKLLRDPRVQFQVTVPKIDVQSAAIRDGALNIRFDFRLEAR